jgi:hypothetical protein
MSIKSRLLATVFMASAAMSITNPYSDLPLPTVSGASARKRWASTLTPSQRVKRNKAKLARKARKKNK